MIAFLWLLSSQWLQTQASLTAHTQSAHVTVHCDNYLTAYRKQGNGNWQLIGTEASWPTPFEYMVSPVTPATQLRFECKDVGGIGGFIASIQYGEHVYSTTNPMSASQFVVTGADERSLVYRTKTSSPWNIRTEGIAENAEWVWDGQTHNTLVFTFSFGDLDEAPEQCYFLEGNAGIIWGDPHTTTFAGVKHDYQGLPANGLDQFYYIHPCHGYDQTDLPYNMIGRHFPYRGSVKVAGFDYMVLELFDTNGDEYVAFFSSAIHEYGQSENTDYDTVTGLSAFTSGTITTIGSRFTIHYIQNDVKKITVTLTVDNNCKLHFTMIGQYDYSTTLGRYTMHYVRVNPPECYKCAVCGLFGDFQGQTMQKCDGSGTVTYGGYTNAWDTRGWTWEKTYTNNNCDDDSTPSPEPYEPEPDPTFPYDPCEDESSALRIQAQNSCEEARDRFDVNECCDSIGKAFCDDLMANCAFDACFTSGENAENIDSQVDEILVDPIIKECGSLIIEDDNYTPFVTKDPTKEPTREPTVETSICCKDHGTEGECLDNAGKPCVWIAKDDPMAIKFNTQCLGKSLYENGPINASPEGGDAPITDICHPEEYEVEEWIAVKMNGSAATMRRYAPQVHIVGILAVAAVILVMR